jgi:hypothetical protein
LATAPISSPPALAPSAISRSGVVQPSFGAPAVAHELARGVDEVVEAVLLVHQPAGLVPALAQLRATAHLRDGDDEAAVQQRQSGHAELWVARNAVGAIAGDQQRRLPIGPRLVGAPGQHQRDAGAVARGGPGTPGGVALGVVAGHRLGFAQHRLAGREVQVPGGQRRGHRGDGVAQQRGRGVERGQKLHGGRVAASRHQVRSRLRIGRKYPQALGCIHALFQHDAALQHGKAVDGCVGTRGNDVLPPVPVVGRFFRRGDEAVVQRVLVRAQHPPATEMVGIGAHLGAAREDHLGRLFGPVRRYGQRLGGGIALDVDDQLPPRRAEPDLGQQRLVGFVVDGGVFAPWCAEAVALHGAALQRHRVLQDVEDAAAVGRPDHRLQHARDLVCQRAAGGQVAKAQRVDAAALGVFRPGDHLPAGADGRAAEVEEGLAAGQRRLVEHHFVTRSG